MPKESVSASRKGWLPGLAPEATPLLGLGLGLTGVLLRLRPRLAAWPLALTAFTVLLYRDPKRATPDEANAIFAPADGVVTSIDELYEHRFLHTDAMRIAIIAAPFDVPIHRSPAAGVVAYLEHTPAEKCSSWYPRAPEDSERLYIGIKTDCGPLLVECVAGMLTHRISCHVNLGTHVDAGARLCTARFGSRVNLLLPLDIAEELPADGERLWAGVTRVIKQTPV